MSNPAGHAIDLGISQKQIFITLEYTITQSHTETRRDVKMHNTGTRQKRLDKEK